MPIPISMPAVCGALPLEGVNAQGTGLELLYQYQSTETPTTIYIPSSQTINSNTVVSYLLLNFEQYYMNNPKIQPYGGIGLGAAFYSSDYQTFQVRDQVCLGY